MEYVNAFLVGGLVCALVQILLDRTMLMPGPGHGSACSAWNDSGFSGYL